MANYTIYVLGVRTEASPTLETNKLEVVDKGRSPPQHFMHTLQGAPLPHKILGFLKTPRSHQHCEDDSASWNMHGGFGCFHQLCHRGLGGMVAEGSPTNLGSDTLPGAVSAGCICPLKSKINTVEGMIACMVA